MTHVLAQAVSQSPLWPQGLGSQRPHVLARLVFSEMSVVLRLVLMVLLFSVFFFSANAQENAAIKGTVVDAKAASVAGAKVKLTPHSGAHETEVTTDESGAFSFDNQPAGDYTITVVAPGFELAERKVTVATSPVPPIQIRLKLSQVTEKVNVSAYANPLSPEQNADRVHLDDRFLGGLPMLNGDPLSVASIFTDPSVAGAMGPQILVDGVPADALELPLSSIKDLVVNQNPYSPEFGRPGRGRIEVKTKHRIHQKFHGAVFSDFQNSVFDARNAFATVTPLHQQDTSEAELEGPLSRTATFLISARHEVNNDTAVIDAQTLSGPVSENLGTPERNTHLFGRLNFRLNANHKLSITYKYKNKLLKNQGVGGFDLPERATDYFDHHNEFNIFETATTTPHLLNEFRAAFRQRRQDTTGLTDQPAILVLGFFNAGGAQIATHRRDTYSDFEDIATLSRGIHTLRFGGGFSPKWVRAVDASNFGGTFTFSCLDPSTDPASPCSSSSYSLNTPAQFTLNFGDPQISFSQHEFYSFLQDEMRMRRNVSLVLGIRYEGQSNGNTFKNVAPRLAFAYSPGSGHTVLRGGFGIFYERQPDAIEQLARLYDGTRIRQIVIANPSYPNPFPPGVTPSSIPPSNESIDVSSPDLAFPYLLQGSFAIERKLGKGENYLTADFTTVRGLHLYRTRNINAPLPGTPGSTLVPNPGFANIDQFESTGSSRSNSVTLTLRTRPSRNATILLQYVFSHSFDDTSGIYSLPADNYDLRPEWGRSDYDRRHRLNLAGTYAFPWGFSLGAIVKAYSGPPFNITTGTDNNNDTVFSDRPPGVTRNTGHGPASFDAETRISKAFRLSGRDHSERKFEIAVDAFNLFNNVNRQNFVGDVTSPFFGQAVGADPARRLQLSLRFTF
jgi:carboxypeptidase family protein